MQTPLDPDIAAVLPKLPDWNVPGQTAQGARDLLTAIAQSRKDLPLPQPHSIENRVIEEAIEVRIYRGALTAAPTIVFFHGGGFVAGDLDTHDRQARWLAVDVGAVVVSVHYRRPPEAKFPAAFDDALAVTRWAAAHVAELGGLPGALGVAGDSAGGNLAAAVAIACRDQGLALAAQLLVYPVTDCAGVYASSILSIRRRGGIRAHPQCTARTLPVWLLLWCAPPNMIRCGTKALLTRRDFAEPGSWYANILAPD
ncbi:MAG: alpha/beta hydrolase fold domain-containing protein [Quisquiliibacterium sp.]